jgi:AcrR family transcriptional regulator
MPPHEDSRRRLVQAALKLFAAQGYYHTTIADILKESGAKRGSLYYHFPSKKELGFAAIDEGLRLLVEQGVVRHLRTKGHPVDRLLKVLDDLPSVVRLETIDSSASDVSVRLGAVDAEFRERLATRYGVFIDQLEAILRRSVAESQIVESVDPRVLTRVFVVMCEGIQFAAMLGQPKVTWEDARRWLKEYLNSLRK